MGTDWRRWTTHDEQTFCIYCQVEYRTPNELARHINKMHPNTYAFHDVLIKDPK